MPRKPATGAVVAQPDPQCKFTVPGNQTRFRRCGNAPFPGDGESFQTLDKLRFRKFSGFQIERNRTGIPDSRRNRIAEQIIHLKTGKIEFQELLFPEIPYRRDRRTVFAVNIADNPFRELEFMQGLRPKKRASALYAGTSGEG